MFIFWLMLVLYPGVKSFPIKNCFTRDLDIVGVIKEDKIDYVDVNAIVRYFLEWNSKGLQQVRVSIKYGDNLRTKLGFTTLTNSSAEKYFEAQFSYPLQNDYDYFDEFNPLIISDKDIEKCVQYFNENSQRNTTRLVIWFVHCGKHHCSHTLDQSINTTRFMSNELQVFFLIFNRGNINRFSGRLKLRNILELNKMVKEIDVSGRYFNYNYTILNRLGLRLCGECMVGWIKFQSNQKPFITSCYYLGQTSNLNRKNSLENCKHRYSELINVESHEELYFLTDLLSQRKYIMPDEETHLNGKALYIHTGLVSHSYHWSNNRPVLINFTTNTDRNTNKEHLTEECLVLRQKENLKPNITSFKEFWLSLESVECARSLLAIAICETSLVGDWTYGNEFDLDNFGNYLREIDTSFLFPCGERGRYIHYNEVCDGIINCKNARDEQYCFRDDSQKNGYGLKCSVKSFGYLSEAVILEGYRCNGRDECFDGSDEMDCDPCDEQKCSDGTCLPKHWFDPGNTHCKFSRSHVVNAQDIPSYRFKCNSDDCVYPRQLSLGVRFCNDQSVEWAPQCIFLRKRSGQPIGCHDFSHLESCEDFICPKDMVKCPFSYCIPFHYVNDLVMDCRYGEDESSTVSIADNSLKRCIESHPKMRICHGKTECDDFADELDCHSYCAAGFKCQAGVVIVDDYNKSEPFRHLPRFDRRTKVFHLTSLNLSIVSKENITQFNQLLELHLSNCSLTEDHLFYFEKMNDKLYTVDLSYNKFKRVSETGMLSKLINLQMINISHNLFLHFIHHKGIVAKKILYLDMSHTMISFLPDSLMKNSIINHLYLQHTKIHSLDWFSFAFQLYFLNLQYTPLHVHNVLIDYFKNATIVGKLIVDHYTLCCPLVTGQNIPRHVCQSPSDPISSCDRLIGDVIKKVMLWMMGSISTVGNAAVVAHLCFCNRAIPIIPYCIFITNIAVADFLMGVYLILIASADIFYGDTYVLFERDWRHSPLCKFSGFLSTFSSEASIMFACLGIVYRSSSDTFFTYVHKRKMITVSIAAVWAYGFIISLLPLIYADWTLYSSNGLCRSLPLTAKDESGWMYSFTTLVVLKLTCVVFIVIGQVAICRSLVVDKKLSIRNSPRHEREIDVAKQLFINALIHCLCWFPISVLGLFSFKGQIVSLEMYAWLIVFVLPLNSAVNPMTYALPILYKKWLEFKKGVKAFPLKDCFTVDLDLLIVLDSWDKEFLVVKEIVKYLTDRPSQRNNRTLRLAIKQGLNLETALGLHWIHDYRELYKNSTFTAIGKERQKLITENDLNECREYFNTNSLRETKRLAIWIVRCDSKRCNHRLDPYVNTTRFVSDEMSLLFLVFAKGNMYKFTENKIVHNILKLDETTMIETNQLGIKLCGECKEGWIHYQSEMKPIVHSCYYVGDERQVNKEELRKECQAKYSTFVNVETNEELFFIEKVLNKTLHLLKPGNDMKEIMIYTGKELDIFFWSNRRPILTSDKYNTKTSHSIIGNLKYNSLLHLNNYGIYFAWQIISSVQKIVLFCEEFINELFYYNQFEPIMESNPRYKDFLFQCEDSSANTIHYNEVCDEVIHCENARDEEYCHKEEKVQNQCENAADEEHCYGGSNKEKVSNQFLCQKHDLDFPSTKNIPRDSVCDRKIDCLDGSDERDCGFDCDERQCDDGTCLPRHWLDESNDRCQFNWSFQLDHDPYTYPRQLQLGYTFCDGWEWSWAPRCVHLRGRDGQPLGCSDLSHLENCEDFICTAGLVKCPHSFCIPVNYLQDDMMDCVYGEDESNDVIIDDVNLRMCIRNNPRVKICDGKTECDNFADELDCHSYCATGFKCQAGVVIVDDYNKREPFRYLSRFDGRTKVFHLSGVNLSLSSNEKINKFHQLLEVQFSECSIHKDQVFYFNETNHRLYSFDASYNNIVNITNHGMFSKLKNLQFLNLSHNKHLESIDPEGIAAEKIICLDLSYTKLSFLPENWLNRSRINKLHLQHTHIYSLQWLPYGFHLTYLNIENTFLREDGISSNYFKNATITEKLLADNYKLCCPQVTGPGIPQHVCGLVGDAISSCGDLIADMAKRTLLWVMAIAALFGNAAVIIFRVFINRAMFKVSYGMFVISLGVADFMMGVYLLIIASVDIFYRDIYVLHEKYWRLSALCTFSGFLSTLSSESSIFFVSLITLDRFLAMKFPFGQHRFSKTSSIFSTVLAWALSFIIALMPVIYPDWLVYSSNGMCLGLPLTGSGEPGWMYSLTIFIFLNFVMFVLIAIGQVAIYRSLGGRKKISMHNPSRRKNEIDVAKQLFIIAVTDFLCWFPISVLGLLSIKGQIVSREMYAWLIVFVIPLNSAVNPMIYTVPMIYKKWIDYRK
ncbi:hypothetical protein Btru_051142, partial [Bulinus truncatus]